MSRPAEDGLPTSEQDACVHAADEPFALRLEVSPIADSSPGALGAGPRTRHVRRAHDPIRVDPVKVATLRGTPSDKALVVPAGALLQGRICAHALLLSGEIVGTVLCGKGPLVIFPGASIKGQLVASGNVHVHGSVIDYGGGTVITTPGRLVLAPGARVEGDVRSGRLEIHDGAILKGAARGFDR